MPCWGDDHPSPQPAAISGSAAIIDRRIATRPTLASQQRRIESKLRRGSVKAQRRERGFD